MKKIISLVVCLALCIGVLAITASAATAYYIAGTSSLCGSEWVCDDANNIMTDDGDGTWSKTYKDVPAGAHQFKVTDGTWNNCWPGSNFELTLTEACDVTIHFNAETKEVTVDASAQGEAAAPTIEFFGVRGQGTDTLSWDSDLKMTEVSEGIYEYTFENLPGSTWPNIKFTANGSWDFNFGCADGNVGATSGTVNEAVFNGANIWFEVAQESDVTVRLDLTAFDYSTKLGATFTVTIVPVSTGDDSGSTTPDTETDAEPELPTGTITVHAKVPSDWTAVAAYIWAGDNNNTWPGASMTLGDNGWYTVEVPEWAENVIINNGGNGSQTQDIAITAGKDVWIVVEASDSGFVGTLTYEAPYTGDTGLIAVCAAMVLACTGAIAVIGGKKKFF